MCDEGAGVPYNGARAERLKQLAQQLSLDAIILITGFDGCYNLESKGLVEWLCDSAAVPSTDFRAAALEEGLFVAMPNEMVWHVEQESDSMADDAVCALDRLLADPSAAAATTAAAADGPADVDMQPAASTPTGQEQQPQQQQQQQQVSPQDEQQLDGKLSLLLQLHPRLRRVGIALGVEVLGGVQQQVHVENIFRWPLLMAAAEQLNLPLEQLFQEIVDITPTLRSLLGFADGTLLSNTLRTRRPLLTRAWLETLALCGRRSSTPKLDLTEAGVAAPVTEFVSGCGCRLKPGQYQPLALPPRVLFGARTSHHEALSSPAVSLRSQAAVQGAAVLHATLEAADACSPLRVARTIFFSQGAAAADTPLQLRLRAQQQQQQAHQQGNGDVSMCCAPLPAATAAPTAAAATPTQAAAAAAAAGPGSSSAGDEAMDQCDSGAANNCAGTCCGSKQQQQQPKQQQQQPQQPLAVGQGLSNGDFDPDQTDLFDLMCWYWSAVDAAWQGMEYYATKEGATWPSAHTFASQVFWASAAAAQLAPPEPEQHQQDPSQQQQQQQWPHKPTLQLQLFSWDGGPRPMPSGTHLEQHNSRVKTLRVTVSDIRSRSPAHPGMALGNVLYMDSFLDVPAVGSCPPRLINLTLTHCPTNTFDFWGAEAALNNGRIAAFRRHLQIQLQSQLQAQESQAQAAALRRSADDSAVLRMQLQQGRGSKGLRRASMPQAQQQMLLMQQLAGAAGGRGNAQQQQQQRQQMLMQLQQQQQKGRGSGGGAGSNGGSSRQEPPGSAGRGSKHSLGGSGSSCCGEPDAAAAAVPYHDSSNGQQALKRSCCGSSQPQSSSGLGGPSGAIQLQASLLDSLAPGPEATPGPSTTAAAAGAAAPGADGGGGGSSGGSNAAVAAAAVAAAQCWRQLGRLLVPPGEMPGEVALVLTGAMKLAVMDGPLYPHSSGLVLVSRPTKVHVLLLDQIEAVWLQDFSSRIPGYPDIGPCIVIRGKQPCCGLLPAVHMTDNNHVAIPLRAMSKVCSQHWVTAVLPAWQAAAGVVKASKGASAAWPLPAEFQPFYTYWLQGPRKRYMLPQPDEELDQLVQVLDRPQHQQTHQVQG